MIYIKWGCKQPEACRCSSNLHGIHEGLLHELQVVGGMRCVRNQKAHVFLKEQ